MMQLSIVALAVSDHGLSQAFYLEKLGCKVHHQHAGSDGRAWSILSLPGGVTRIALVAPSDIMPAGSTKGLILTTLDIENTRSRLVDRGLAIGEIGQASFGRRAAFADPDGNGWMLVEQVSRMAG
jgi:catechol 2,3-dioxygenase-like lactoylglutathione lyase family enzyme